MKKTNLYFDKPVYVGMCILDLGKTLMYNFHYIYIIEKYGEKAKLLFTDTDSLMYEIEPKDFYKGINNDVKDKFDTSDYLTDHPSGIPTGLNKKVIGMFKDEAYGMTIEEFGGLTAKLYSYKMFDDGKESKKCKSIKQQVLKDFISHEHYKKCLFVEKDQYRKMTVIRSYNHHLYTEQVNKVALSGADYKPYVLGNKIDTLAWGHRKIKLI